MTGFSSLNTAVSGLLAHRKAIELIGHNVANVNTDGYTRRRLDLESAGPGMAVGRWSTGGTYGTGVDIAGVTRIRDQYVDTRMRRELGTTGAADRLASIYISVEQLMPEPSDTGIATQLAEYWSAWDDVANQPESIPARAALASRAETLAETFRSAHAALTDMRDSLVKETKSIVHQVNTDAQGIADLNGKIVAAKVAGVDTGDLEDQRDLLVDRVAQATGAVARYDENGSVTLTLGGTSMVYGTRMEGLKVEVGGLLDPPHDTLPLTKAEVRWATDGYPINGLTGSLSGLQAGMGDVVPRFMADLNAVASSVVTTTNTLHQTGHGLDTVNDVNLDFWDAAGLTADTLGLSADIAGQPSRIAVGAGGSGALDGALGHQLAATATSTAGPDALHRSLVGRLGVEVNAAVRRSDLQATIVTQITGERDSISGVNLDEEMASLVMFQRAYEASARLLTTVDEMLDTLINRVGIVGR